MSCRCGYRKNLLEARHRFDAKQAACFDYNATTPVRPEVLGVLDRVQRNGWHNPSSLHSAGLNTWQIIDDARNSLSGVFGVPAEGFLFAASAATVFSSVMGAAVFDDILLCTTAVEHSCIHKPARFRQLAGRPVLVLPVDSRGRADLSALEKIATQKKICMVFSPVNHETGAVQPVKEICAMVRKYKGQVILDSVQAAARLPAAEWARFADMFVFSGHKIYGPKGIASVWIDPAATGFLRNWRRQGFWQGTANVPGIAGLAKAAELLAADLKNEAARLTVLMREGLEILAKKTDFTINSPTASAAGICNISLPWVGNMTGLLFELDARNIQLSRFSACSAGLHYPSRILLAMGKGRTDACNSLRICLGKDSGRRDFYILADALSALQKSGI
ncbi:MAG: aminotransferase class V-fold PLP-dependent enzyme [Spirochaetales bacterium]|nr:aminotransferase class V-fold PLP-dependent enzyme [Spirochaetales bacterium]